MTRTADKGKKATKGAKKLSLKKETVKNLDTGPGKAKELGDDQLGGVNGGNVGNVVRASVVNVCVAHLIPSVIAGGCAPPTRPVCEGNTAIPGCSK